jgi:pimeloyl-ACP methyl ester carboxylesterase
MLKVNDIQMYYEVHGEGFPLMMIAGLGANVDWWDPRWIQGFSEEFKTVAFDNRGAGHTDVSDEEYSIALFADDTAGLMDAMGISRAHVLGISMGGMIAQDLALNYPEKVQKLVLCSTSCGGAKSIPVSQEVLTVLMTDRSALSPEEIARTMIPLLVTEDFLRNNPELAELAIQQMVKAPISNKAYMRQLKAILNFDTCARLSQIKAPTLILQGKRDILVPPENASMLDEAIPNAKLVYFENSAHGLLEETETVLRSVLEFLRKS